MLILSDIDNVYLSLMFAVILYKYCVNINSVFWQQKLPSMGYRPNSVTNNIVANLM